MNLWDWAVRAYGSAGVESLCLELQDRHGLCVCLLLWSAWAASEGRATASGDLERAASVARAWEEHAIGPLRAARRGLKAALPGVDDGRREELRAQARALELSAERLLLDALEAGTAANAGPALDVADALARTALVWNGGAPEQLGALAAAFSRV